MAGNEAYIRQFMKDDKNITFIGKYMEAYIPISYFDKGIAELIGDHFKTIGVYNFRIFNDIDGTKAGPVKCFKLPIEIYTYPSGGFEIKSLDLIGKGEEQYYVLKYYNTDVLCASKIAQSPASFQSFLNLLMSGKVPKTIPYKAVIEIWAKNFDINGVNFDIPDVIKELVVSQIYRNPKKPEYTFGSMVGRDPSISQYDYLAVGPRDVTKNASTYAGFTFEDMDEMTIAALNNSKTNRKETISPMEQILKF